MAKKSTWSQGVGPYGHRIRLYEDARSGLIQAEMRDVGRPGHYRSVSLRHRNRDEAVKWAHSQVSDWMERGEQTRNPRPTVAVVLGLYLTHKSPLKSLAEQHADQRRAKLWTRYLGPQTDLATLSMRVWDSFISDRKSGRMDAQGSPVPPDDQRVVRDGTVAGDLTFLTTVLNWASRWRTEAGAYLMSENPARGYSRPQERNPRRPLVTTDRFEKVRAVAAQVMMVVGRGKTRRETPSYLPELLDLAYQTGRRISAILKLRWNDVDLNRSVIRWRAESDKVRREWVVPINASARLAIERILAERPGIGETFLFPAINDPSKPLAIEVASPWLLEAERLAGVEKHQGSLWHAYRRGWATARKHLPVQDVMAAGGWTDPTVLQTAYQQADELTMTRVVTEPVELREVR